MHLYTKCEAMVVPSAYEGFGLPILDSIINNVPLFCSDIKPFRELAQGFAQFFNQTSVDHLSSLIEDVQNSRFVIKKEKSNILSNYNWEKSGKSLKSLYENY